MRKINNDQLAAGLAQMKVGLGQVINSFKRNCGPRVEDLGQNGIKTLYKFNYKN